MTFTEAPIISNEEVAPEHFLMRVHAPGLAAGAPGQFAVIRPSAGVENHPLLPRPMAVYRYFPNEGDAELVYRVVGEGLRPWPVDRPGETAEIVGPRGVVLLFSKKHAVFSSSAGALASVVDGPG